MGIYLQDTNTNINLVAYNDLLFFEPIVINHQHLIHILCFPSCVS